jgi:hypothetical protein
MMEGNRRKTFNDWPVTFISKNEMVAAGFYYVGKEDRVRCPFCEVQVENWAPGDEPLSIHKRVAAYCGFVLGYFSDSDS